MDRNLINSTTCDENIINDNTIPLSFKDQETQEPCKPYISIVIPVYNEEKNIETVLKRIPNHQKYEIIVVDDGSTDKTVKVVQSIKDNRIKLLKHDKNRGYGAAILSGVKVSKGDIIITMDSDGQHCPEEIPLLIEPITNNEADVVIGSRYLGNCKYKVPFYTKLGEKFINLCFWILYRKKVLNNQSGFRAFSKKARFIFQYTIYNKFAFCTEILFKAAHYNLKIIEKGITVNPRKYGSSYINLIKILISISVCILIYGVKKTLTLIFK
ncbi:MAG: glycosyltransferase family 2 protein [Promethearchaeia archaeon]